MDPPDPVFVLRGAGGSISALTFSKPNQDVTRHLIAGTQSGSCVIWDLKTKATTKKWNGHGETSILWLNQTSNNQIWCQGRDNGVKLWDIGKEAPICVASYSSENYLGFCSSDITALKNNCLLALPGPELDIVCVYDTSTNICISRLKSKVNIGNVMQMKWIDLNSQPYLLISYENGTLSLWDWSNGSVISSNSINETPMCLEFNNKTMKGICGTGSEKLFPFHISIQKEVSLAEPITITNDGVACCTSRFDGKIFATGGWDSRVRLFGGKKMKPLAVLMYHRKTVQCMKYSDTKVDNFPNGNILAVGSLDESISMWDIFNENP